MNLPRWYSNNRHSHMPVISACMHDTPCRVSAWVTCISHIILSPNTVCMCHDRKHGCVCQQCAMHACMVLCCLFTSSSNSVYWWAMMRECESKRNRSFWRERTWVTFCPFPLGSLGQTAHNTCVHCTALLGSQLHDYFKTKQSPLIYTYIQHVVSIHLHIHWTARLIPI